MDAALGRHGIRLPDRQLSCAPLSSEEGSEYRGAMAAAANFAWANRQAIAHGVRRAIERVLGREVSDRTRQV
jgi:tRNA-splicing ligase RtcB